MPTRKRVKSEAEAKRLMSGGRKNKTETATSAKKKSVSGKAGIKDSKRKTTPKAKKY